MQALRAWQIGARWLGANRWLRGLDFTSAYAIKLNASCTDEVYTRHKPHSDRQYISVKSMSEQWMENVRMCVCTYVCMCARFTPAVVFAAALSVRTAELGAAAASHGDLAQTLEGALWPSCSLHKEDPSSLQRRN